jgi:hypothetical protein
LQFPNFTLRLSLKFHTDTGLAQQKGRSVTVNLNADSIHSTGLLTMRPLAFSKFLSETLCISLNVQRKANLNCAETQILCMYMVFLYQQTVLVDCEWYYFVTHTTLSTVCTRLQPQAHSLTSAPATALCWLGCGCGGLLPLPIHVRCEQRCCHRDRAGPATPGSCNCRNVTCTSTGAPEHGRTVGP